MNKETSSTKIMSDEEFLKEIFQDQGSSEDNSIKETKLTPDEELNKIIQGDESETGPDTDKEDNPDKNGNTEKPQEEEDEEDKVIKRFGVKDTILSLVNVGEWEDMPIKYGDKEYESIEDLLSKERPTRELFEQLSNAQKSYREAQLETEYIRVGGKDNIKAKLIEAIANDLPYEDLLQYNKEVIEPLQKIDFANVENGDYLAEQFVRQCLVEIDNYHPDSVDVVVDKLKKDFQIISMAEKYQEQTLENFNQEIERRQQEVAEQRAALAEIQKQEMKVLREETKKQGISDAFASKVLKLRYTQDPSTNLYHYQMLIEDKLREDPSFSVQLMHFLIDPSDFISKQKSEAKKENSRRYLELMKVANSKEKSSKTTKKTNNDNLQTSDEDFLREIGLIENDN